MTRGRKPSAQTAAVLQALSADPAGWRYGYDLCRETGLKAGSLYPILIRLADRGQVEAQWEQEAPPGRPARHMYRLTATGLALAETSAEAGPAPVQRASLRPRPVPRLGGS
jgi:PadR family transcriptional regulator, regulatory protein PadR